MKAYLIASQRSSMIDKREKQTTKKKNKSEQDYTALYYPTVP